LGYSNTEEKVENTINAQRSIFDEIRSVRIVDETLSLAFDTTSQSKLKPKELTEK